MPSTLIVAVRTGVRSAVSRATTAPPIESPTNSTPSGPNASAPADFSSTLPGVSVAAALTDSRMGQTSAVSAAARHNPSAARTTIRYCIVPPQKKRTDRNRGAHDTPARLVTVEDTLAGLPF